MCLQAPTCLLYPYAKQRLAIALRVMVCPLVVLRSVQLTPTTLFFARLRFRFPGEYGYPLSCLNNTLMYDVYGYYGAQVVSNAPRLYVFVFVADSSPARFFLFVC